MIAFFNFLISLSYSHSLKELVTLAIILNSLINKLDGLPGQGTEIISSGEIYFLCSCYSKIYLISVLLFLIPYFFSSNLGNYIACLHNL